MEISLKTLWISDSQSTHSVFNGLRRAMILVGYSITNFSALDHELLSLL